MVIVVVISLVTVAVIAVTIYLVIDYYFSCSRIIMAIFKQTTLETLRVMFKVKQSNNVNEVALMFFFYVVLAYLLLPLNK